MPSTKIDTSAVPLWLDTLLSPTGLVMWEDDIPRGQPLPAILIKMQGATDTYYVGRARALIEQTWQIKVVKDDSWFDSITDKAKQIDDLLLKAPNASVAGYNILSVRRQSAVRYKDLTDVEQVHLGGLYKIQLYEI